MNDKTLIEHSYCNPNMYAHILLELIQQNNG